MKAIIHTYAVNPNVRPLIERIVLKLYYHLLSKYRDLM